MKNSHSHYGWVAILFHWVFALGIFGLFGLGLYMVELTYYDPWYKGSLDLHKGAGILLALLWIFRLIWKWKNTDPEIEANSEVERLLAKAGHAVLYLLPLLLFVSGYLISTADGRSIDVFGLFEVGALPAIVEEQESLAGDIHLWLAWGLIGFVVLHIAAALKHHFINKDQTLNKILGRRKV